MNFDRSEWIGNWENFELYFTDDAPAMVRSWEDAEKSVKENKNGLISAILFRHGAKFTCTPSSRHCLAISLPYS